MSQCLSVAVLQSPTETATLQLPSASYCFVEHHLVLEFLLVNSWQIHLPWLHEGAFALRPTIMAAPVGRVQGVFKDDTICIMLVKGIFWSIFEYKSARK